MIGSPLRAVLHILCASAVNVVVGVVVVPISRP
jgi:hypothetical protein